MKRMMILILSLMLLLLPVQAFCSEADRELVVGNTTHLNSDFFTDLWGNATSDLDVRKLIHSYNLVNWNFEQGVFQTNPTVVTGFVATENAAGDHTYQIAVNDELRYSDGSPITAWDYAFSIMLQLCPQMKEIGAGTGKAEYIQGAGSFMDGAAVLSGVRVLSDYEMTVTVDAAYLPYFYELGLLSFQPYPIHVIAPGTVVKDDGAGVYFANEDETASEPAFTAELLRSTVLDPDHGYRSHPSVTSGPYVLDSYDGVTAEFSINPYFAGDAKGRKPSIEKLVYTLAENGTMVAALEAGEFDLLNKVSSKEAVAQGLALTTQKKGIAMSNYPRSGMSFLAVTGSSDILKDVRVRKALAWAMDKDAVADGYEGNYGLPAGGYYGIGQWMVGLLGGTIAYPVTLPDNADAEQTAAYEREIEEWKSLSMDGLETYGSGSRDSDLAAAAALLDEAGWNLNGQGEPFAPGTDTLRFREENGSLAPLSLTLACPRGNTVKALLEEHLAAPLSQIGAELVITEEEMTGIFADYYGQSSTGADLLFLASNFDEIFDPAANFHVNDNGEAVWGYTGIADEALYDLALEMRHTKPGDTLNYCRRWLSFQQRFNETLPLIPIYSNVYFDFYTDALTGYEPVRQVSWAQEILYASLER